MGLGRHLHRRLDRLETSNVDFEASLGAARIKAEERLRAWGLEGRAYTSTITLT
jgi:hypothetical protein